MAYRISKIMVEKIGKNIRKARKKLDKDQTEIAEAAGIDGSYLAKIEKGESNPSLEVLYAIVKALHVKSSDILPF